MQTPRAITRAAEELLDRGKVRRLPVPVFELAKLAGAIVRIGPLPAELSGFLYRQRNSAILGVNSLHSATRQRFTVAHEVGHLLLHREESFVDRRYPIFLRDEKSSKAKDKVEIQANRFAAELLMPACLLLLMIGKTPPDIDDAEQIARLARRFDVSPQAMVFRLINLGITASPNTAGARQT
jgi:Zn-dependent peptidase ImmA (M78 family)